MLDKPQTCMNKLQQNKLTIAIPNGVLLRTFSRKRSPELIDANWGNRARSLSVCVPFPTPGAPTRMTRAALESCFATDAMILRAIGSLKWTCRDRSRPVRVMV